MNSLPAKGRERRRIGTANPGGGRQHATFKRVKERRLIVWDLKWRSM